MDVSSPAAVARLLVPKLPFMISTAVYHYLGISPTSSRWDLKTEITVSLIRRIMENQQLKPLSRQQAGSKKDPGIKGKMWVSKVTIPSSGLEDTVDILCKAIDSLKETGKEIYTTPPIIPVEAEWIGYRSDATPKSPRPRLPEDLQYKYLMSDTKSSVTIMYMHGGALVAMDPATHRLPCSNLAHLTGGRCFSVRYRLAPQNPFPSALLDVLTAYLALLYPPSEAYHDAVSSKNIIFAGDSAGGTLSFALLQLLLQINRLVSSGQAQRSTLHVLGHEVSLPIPLPGGVASTSAWLDLTQSLPSIDTNYAYDYLPRKNPTGQNLQHFPHDDIWPAKPPRNDLYCDASMLCHPLASPIRGPSWEGSPPLFMGCGDEMLMDENKAVAAKAAAQGVPVVWQEYEAMPHCGCMFFPNSPLGELYFANWAEFCSKATKGEISETKGTRFKSGTLANIPIPDVTTLAVCSEEDMKRLMDDSRAKREAGLETETTNMPKT